jgi:hypothetical protein
MLGERGRKGKPVFVLLWESCHFVDIHAAVADGLPANIEELKAAMDGPEGWAQEFECQFLDVQSTLLPYELIAPCEEPGGHRLGENVSEHRGHGRGEIPGQRLADVKRRLKHKG